ncbi:PQQ-dependent sugar dehydrogenase [Pluralibacter gergoviae]|uniref:PQQ-dependent sugar dehydrogenase n=1 Tax=Pluralibacter gergoviae TaxID=61647 RepID=A0AAI9DQ79_PLUGE|nr:glucose/sorbosone family PQQ-dependent dehydrogenase [Pluralibacter gergoviae]EKT9641975.1 PQQ-dependent sugar dehydrogenase [Pluralibacter gergoviae]EKV0917760.1 PQQ-dependent sugar dehydrogenase [Pluralibacter gergoviae]EKV3545713.1 PQQ-dependent sugar dehydrogenase [Pluralibacter gergoviae]EKV9898796.1 PQQ-dependent sugar dehydrogenase [Pluralibacter gergoviae]EKV9909739.1 PQQ-dependent sugar dehydrogenase [Pluralibacter gergoviae]
MNKLSLIGQAVALSIAACGISYAADSAAQSKVQIAEPFAAHVLVSGLDAPWDMVWAPDGYLWVTERKGATIDRIDPKSGKKQVLVKIADVKIGPQHEGVLGLALSPDFLKSDSKNYVYAAYTYMNGDSERAKIVRFEYDPKAHTLGNQQDVLAGIPAGSDHNGGRLRFGPDGKLYYTIGEQGHNQGKHVCEPIEAQRLPTSAELEKKDYSAYVGKVLRLNSDGSIPDDNPVIEGVKSHLFTYGHRNPQGLVFVGDTLYSSEQGPSSDDELNILQAGGNYGWPHVAGYRDDQAYVYANYSKAKDCESVKYDPNHIPDGVPVQKETDWNAPNFKPPVKTFFTVPQGYTYSDASCGDSFYMCWPTIAPSSVAYYPKDGVIKSFRNSLLITSLKNGAIYRVLLNDDTKNVQGDVAKEFHTTNRYRMAVVSPDTRKIYVATDNFNGAMDESNKPTQNLANPGSIIVFEYTGK